MKHTATEKRIILRELLNSPEALPIPGAHDCLTAKIIESLGFSAVYLSGYGVSSSMLARPDMGFITMENMASVAGHIIDAVDLPLISDIDTGFGGLNNLTTTIHLFERIGVSGVHFEDQSFPKKCGCMKGRTVIPMEDMVAKIKAAVDTREDPQFIIIARLDSKASEGFESILRRGDAYLDAGADFLLPGEQYPSDYSWEEFTTIANRWGKRLIVFSGIPDLPEQNMPLTEYNKLGVAGVIYASPGLMVAHKAIREVYTKLKEDALTPEYLFEHALTLVQNNAVVGVPYYEAQMEKYGLK